MSPRLARYAGCPDADDIMIGGEAADKFQECTRLQEDLETLGEQANTKEFNIAKWKVIRLGRTDSTFKCKFNELEQEETNEGKDSGWCSGAVGIAAARQVNNSSAEILEKRARAAAGESKTSHRVTHFMWQPGCSRR